MTYNNIQAIASAKQNWKQPVFPESTDQEWLAALGAADDVAEENLVRAWFWSLYLETVDMDELEFEQYCTKVLVTQFELAPYLYKHLSGNCRVPARYVENPFALTNVFNVVVESDEYYPTNYDNASNHIKLLWLSEDTLRLGMLMEELPLEGVTAGPWLNLLPGILDQTASLAGATEEHYLMAKYYAYRLGMLGCEANANTPPALIPWIKLGAINKRAITRTNNSDVEFGKEVLTKAPAKLALYTAKKMLETALGIDRQHRAQLGNKHERMHHDTFLGEATGAAEKSNYDRLRMLVPQCKAVLNSCEAMGMSIDEACKHIGTINFKVVAELPEDLTFADNGL